MVSLKDILGDKYKPEMTLADAEKALGEANLVDLRSGKYVDSDKYNRAKDEAAAAKEQLGEFEKIKPEYESLKAEKAKSVTYDRLKKAGIDERFLKYADQDLKEGVIKDDPKDPKVFEESVKGYLKSNPQFVSKDVRQTPKPERTEPIGGAPNQGETASHEAFNKTLAEAFGVERKK